MRKAPIPSPRSRQDDPMTARNRKSSPSLPAVDTRTKLIDGAMREFNEFGYGGTDTNRIARRAGFAPQTFYRWFKDKTDIFVAAYHAWEESEHRTMSELLARKASTKQLVDYVVAHHRDHRIFRRSLRQLSLEDPTVRSARAASRNRQIEQIRAWHRQYQGTDSIGAPALAALLLQMERLADALAENEFVDMGVSTTAARQALADMIDTLRVARRW